MPLLDEVDSAIEHKEFRQRNVGFHLLVNLSDDRFECIDLLEMDAEQKANAAW
jgi:hypothetical protein